MKSMICAGIKALWCAAWAAGIILCAYPAHAARPLTAQEKAAVEKAVKEKLKDPDSAKFKWPDLVNEKGGYCGLVNARNSYGGYSGFTPFMAFILFPKKEGEHTGAMVLQMASDNPDDSMTGAVIKVCQDQGYELGD